MISKNIAILRKRENISQEKLAEEIGVSRQTIANGKQEKAFQM